MNPRTEIKKRFLKVMRLAIAEQWEGIDNKKEFAEVADIMPQQLYAIETQKGRNPTPEMIYNVCKRFGVSANYIIIGIEPMKLTDSNNLESRLKRLEKVLLKPNR